MLVRKPDWQRLCRRCALTVPWVKPRQGKILSEPHPSEDCKTPIRQRPWNTTWKTFLKFQLSLTSLSLQWQSEVVCGKGLCGCSIYQQGVRPRKKAAAWQKAFGELRGKKWRKSWFWRRWASEQPSSVFPTYCSWITTWFSLKKCQAT